MKKLLILSIIVIVAGVVLYFGMSGKKLSQISNLGSSPTESQTEGQEEKLAPVEPNEIFAEPVVYGALKESYSGQNFSFKYPDGFKVSSVPASQPSPSEVEGEIITLENNKGNGFQIFAMSFDEPGPITPERIWRDQPDAEINDPKNAQLDDLKALVFNGYDEDLGETFEAWAVYKNKLYQISGPKTAEKLITETLETWRWK